MAAIVRGGVGHWRAGDQAASAELFAIRAASTGTNLVSRKVGEPLPRLTLDGIAVVEWNDEELCTHPRWWPHSVAAA